MKQEIHHRVLNLFTMMNYLLSDHPFGETEQKECHHLLKTAMLLTEHEDVFMKKMPSLFHQEVDLKAILDIILGALNKTYSNQQRELIFPQESMIITADRYYLDKALRLVLEPLFESGHKVHCEINPSAQQLSIHHDRGRLLADIPSEPHLRGSFLELSKYVSYHILKFCDITLADNEGLLTLSFPGQPVQERST